MSYNVISIALHTVLNAHFDNHPLVDRLIFIDDNTRTHIARSVGEMMQLEPIVTFQWPAMGPYWP
jgi:hypothetical protein